MSLAYLAESFDAQLTNRRATPSPTPEETAKWRALSAELRANGPFAQVENEVWRRAIRRGVSIGVVSALLLAGGSAIHNGLICAVGYAGFPFFFAFGLKDTIQAGVFLTTWRGYHRSREPVRYWLGVVLLSAGLTLFVVAGIAVILREGLNGFIPHPGGLLSTRPE